MRTEERNESLFAYFLTFDELVPYVKKVLNGGHEVMVVLGESGGAMRLDRKPQEDFERAAVEAALMAQDDIEPTLGGAGLPRIGVIAWKTTDSFEQPSVISTVDISRSPLPVGHA